MFFNTFYIGLLCAKLRSTFPDETSGYVRITMERVSPIRLFCKINPLSVSLTRRESKRSRLKNKSHRLFSNFLSRCFHEGTSFRRKYLFSVMRSTRKAVQGRLVERAERREKEGTRKGRRRNRGRGSIRARRKTKRRQKTWRDGSPLSNSVESHSTSIVYVSRGRAATGNYN